MLTLSKEKIESNFSPEEVEKFHLNSVAKYSMWAPWKRPWGGGPLVDDSRIRNHEKNGTFRFSQTIGQYYSSFADCKMLFLVNVVNMPDTLYIVDYTGRNALSFLNLGDCLL